MANTPYNFRLNEGTDDMLISMLESTGNKTEFIKNALFHYFLHIARGEEIDRELPLGWGSQYSNLVPKAQAQYNPFANLINYQQDITGQPQQPSDDSYEDDEYDEYDDDEEYEYEDDEDNFHNADFEVEV